MDEYKKLLKGCTKNNSKGDPVLSKYYYVPKEAVEHERAEPGSQHRQPVINEVSANTFLWGQSLYVIASLLTDGLVHPNELDLIRRYLPSYNRPRKAGRYSAFQVIMAFHILPPQVYV